MTRTSRLLMLFLVAVLAASCTQHGPYRTASIVENPPNTVALNRVECRSGAKVSGAAAVGRAALLPACEPDPADQVTSEAIGRSSIQRRHYVYKGKGDTVPTKSGDYDLAFVEFDDQGWFAQPNQVQALFMLLRQIESAPASPENGHALILLYVHGWKHNASQCDDNVICFSRLLERMDILERELREPGAPRRRVVGVYVGWRGLSLDAGALSNVTFWTRKATAERVGRAGVTELLARLNNYRAARNPAREEDQTQLVITGHSFGGLVVYSALFHSLMERAVPVGTDTCDKDEATPATRYRTATSFGDLVVLVNPAFEGSLYEPLFHIATNRCYSKRQRPVMLTVTSAGDDATGVAFPFGRWLNSLFEHARSPEQNDSIRQAVGHDARYETHKLRWRPTDASVAKVIVPGEEACGCRHLEPTETFEWWEFMRSVDIVPMSSTDRCTPPEEVKAVMQADETGAVRRVYEKVYGNGLVLEGDTKYAANYPYLVVTADAAIIEDHNAIYNERFIRFLHSFFLIHIANGRPFEPTGCSRSPEACTLDGQVPCEQSCTIPGKGSCSGPSGETLKTSR